MGVCSSGSRTGSAGSGGNKIITNFEKSIQKNDTESAMIITKTGEVIVFNTRDEHHVFGTKDDIEKMSGGISTHNHPINTTFSSTDILNGMVKGNLNEMRIITKNGEIHSLKNNGATKEQKIKFNTNYRNQEMKAKNNVHAKQRRGESVNSTEYIKNHMENWMSKNAGEYGFSYKKSKAK